MGAATDAVYLRVAEDLRAQIRDGVLGPGARVPSRNGIIARYGVGETAAKHALGVLAAEGLIETKAGSGCYVRAVPAARRLERDRPDFPGSPFGLAGAQAVSWEHRTERRGADRHIARLLGLAEGDPVIRTRYVASAGGSPVQLVTSHEPAPLTGRTGVALPEEGPLAGRGVIARMRAIGVRVDQVTEDISARGCRAEEAAALALPPGAPVLVVDRAHRAGARTVEAGQIVVPADRFRLGYRTAVTGAGPAGTT
jgi:DNA-binding GntR family transcriptional regulator